MNYQREKDDGGLTIEQLEGYIICKQDLMKILKQEIKDYKEILKYRKQFQDDEI